MARIARSIMELRHYGYTEEECMCHTLDWINYALTFGSQQVVERIQMRERMDLQRTMLAGILWHDPDKGSEMYSEMVAALSDDDDDAWLNNPNAKVTDLSQLQSILQRRVNERHESESHTASTESVD